MHVGNLRDHTNAPEDGEGRRQNLMSEGGHEIAPTRGHPIHGNRHREPLFPAKALDLGGR